MRGFLPAVMRLRATRAVMILLLGACALGSLMPTIAEAGSDGRRVHVLHAFGGANDGMEPSSGLARDAQGNLYGVTDKGGAYNEGTAYKIAPDGSYRVLAAFGKHANGAAFPVFTPVVLTDGSLVGSATSTDRKEDVIYKISSGGRQSVLYRFASDGHLGSILKGLIADADGNLYGVTGWGGPSNCGAAFRLNTDGTADLIYAFKGGAADGCHPNGPMTFDAAGNLYGVTDVGGEQYEGAVYKIAPGGAETVLYAFGSGNKVDDGYSPMGPVTLDAAGNLYGTTTTGHNGCRGGTVYEVAPDGTETVLYRFDGLGFSPQYPVGGVIVDADGNVYGTTMYGGGAWNGVAFKLLPHGRLRILHAFNLDEGAQTMSLIFGDNGSLLGVNEIGGDTVYGGTVFKINVR